MSLFFRRDAASELIPARPLPVMAGSTSVTGETALRHSAVWACLRLRADLISTMPVDVFRRTAGGIQQPMPTPPFLVKPDGTRHLTEWLYSTQMDLDRFGNAFGLRTDVAGKVARVELVAASKVSVIGTGSTITGYRVDGAQYEPDRVWHERQYTVSGMPVGLSPVAFAAYTIGGYLSAQQFALDWFRNGAQPSGTLRNTEESKLPETVIAAAKARYKVATEGHDLFVTGKDWEYNPTTMDGASAAFLDEMKFSVSDVARFFGVPGDMIDAESSTGSITYANVMQRNLQLLVMNLGPAIVRREAALSDALYVPQYVKFNTDAILRMDPQQRAELLNAQVAGRTLAPSEARELDNRKPFTPEQLAEFAALFGDPNRTPTQGKGQS